MTFGAALYELRTKKRPGLSLRAFASEIGMDAGNLSKMENDKYEPGVIMVERMIHVLNLGWAEAELLRALSRLQGIAKICGRIASQEKDTE